MKAQATLLGHPIHPMLIVFPLRACHFAVIFDLIYWFTKNPTWAEVLLGYCSRHYWRIGCRRVRLDRLA